jgi:hypothetical protein
MPIQVPENSADRESPAIPFDLVQSIVRLLEPYSPEEQRHVLRTVTTWLRLASPATSAKEADRSPTPVPLGGEVRSDEYRFSGRAEAGPKEFLLEKQPNTDVERMACLAYYLTHYREQRYFKIDDLNKLNMEAAQRIFSNPSVTTMNATRDGFFVPSPKKGYRQLSALGEQYVQALPDHEAARQLRKRMFRRRTGRPQGSAKGQVVTEA